MKISVWGLHLFIYLFIYLSGSVFSGRECRVILVKGNRLWRSAKGTQQRTRSYLLVFSHFGLPPPWGGQAGPPWTWPELWVREALHHCFFNWMPLLVPCMMLQGLDRNPAGCEAGGLSKAQRWQGSASAILAFTHSRSFSIFPFSDCAGPICVRIGPGEWMSSLSRWSSSTVGWNRIIWMQTRH